MISNEDKKSIIIIGSGLGGLSCGVILAKHGYKVTVLEKNQIPGGCLQCFVRKGIRFETGMHYIGSAGRDELLGRLLRYLGVYDSLKLLPLDKDAYDIIKIGDTEYRLPMGYENLISYLGKEFPSERENIQAFFSLVHNVANASSMHRLSVNDCDLATTMTYQMVSINEVVDQYINDPTLRKVIVGNLPLYAGTRDRTPFSTYAFITDFYNRSAYRFADGSDSLSKALIKVIDEAGGQVIVNAEVTKIVCDNHKAVNVTLADGQTLNADYFISSIHPARMLELLSDSKLLRPAYRKRVMSLPDTIGAFSVYLKFKEGKIPYLRSNYFEYPANETWGCEDYTTGTWPHGFLYMHFGRNSDDTASTGVILSYMHYKDVEKWNGTKPMKRGKEYEEFKRMHAERIIDILDTSHPGTRAGIETYYTSTPLTYRDYTGAENGGMYGIAKDITLGAAGRITSATRIPNLFLTGQSINSHGILGVIIGTILTCSDFIPLETIFKEIRNAP